MKKYLFFAFFIGLFIKQSAQCTGGSSGGALNPVPSTSYQTMNCPAGNYYYTFVVPASACYPQYDFSFCSSEGGNASFDTQITILDNTGTAVSGGYNDDYCSTLSHVVWTPTVSGTYRVRVNLYNCVSTTAASTLAYKYTTTYTNTAEYTVNGNATSTGTCTTLTPNTTNQRGCVWDVNSTLNFNSNFTYDFTVNLGASDAGADGMAFVIQNDAKGRCACGTAGGSLGAGGINNSLIVEIDTYMNYEDRDDFNTSFIGCTGTEDPDHLDLWFNGNVNPDLDGNCNATAAGERPVTSTAVRLQNPVGTDYNIENGNNHILRISWATGSPGTFTAKILNTALNITYGTITTTLNPMSIFGTNTPYFGFTASTGGLSNQQTICNPLSLLPVELLEFTAKCNDGSIIVNWQTASETNNKQFELERSYDGVDFKKIATVPGNGTSTTQNNYQFNDTPDDDILYYYRLKQVDFDGKANYYYVIASTEQSCIKNKELQLFPNPANDLFYIQLPEVGNFSIEIINASGQLVYNKCEAFRNNLSYSINTSNLAEGIYLVKTKYNEKSQVKKIMIQHH